MEQREQEQRALREEQRRNAQDEQRRQAEKERLAAEAKAERKKLEAEIRAKVEAEAKAQREAETEAAKEKANQEAVDKQAAAGYGAGASATPEIAVSHQSVAATVSGGGARQLMGLIPQKYYTVIKDFVTLVKPKGTAKEVFEGEIPTGMPACAKWVPWLSAEAQKIAASIMIAGMNGGLSPQQVYSIVLYTMDVRMAGGTLEENFYYNLNPILQKRDMEKINKIEGYLHYLMGALVALPAEPERIFTRGVPKSAFDIVHDHYTSGKRVHWSGISSVTANEDVSKCFAVSEGAGGVVFRITARSGRKIEHLSAIPTEAEILLMPNFQGVVSRSMYQDGDVYIVDIVEEAEDTSAFVF